MGIRGLADQPGWSYETRVGLDRVAGLNLPPFGLGIRRSVKDAVEGQTQQGRWVRVVRYTSSTFERSLPTLQTAVLTPLPHSVDPAFLLDPATDRPYARGTLVPALGGIRVVTDDQDLGAVLASAVVPGLGNLASAFGVDLSLDGTTLVAMANDIVGDEDLLRYIHLVSHAADVVAAAPLPPARRARPPALSFYARPASSYSDLEPGLVGQMKAWHLQAEKVRDVIRFTHRGLSVLTAVREYTTSTGDSTTVHHEPTLLAALPFDFGAFAINRRNPWCSPRFIPELPQGYTIHAGSGQFAAQVARGVGGWLARQGCPDFVTVSGALMLTMDAKRYPDDIERVVDCICDFFAEVPPAAWSLLGYSTPPFAPSLR